MAHFGGLGGVMGGRDRDNSDLFENAVDRCFGEQIRSSEDACKEMWSALANVDWIHENGDTASYSMRAAGDLVAAVRGKGCYMDWYCRSDWPLVSERVENALKREGWSFHIAE